MSKPKSIALWITGGLGALLALLLALVLLAPRLINLDPIKERALVAASEKLGGQVIFQRIELSLFPLPHATFRQASLSIPGKMDGAVESLRIYPKVRALLRGKLLVTDIQMKNPHFKVVLPARPKGKEEASESTPSRDLQKDLTSLMAPLALDLPDLVAEMENGKLDIFEGDQPLFSFRNIHSHLVFPPEGFRLKLRATSNLFEKLTVEATLDSRELKSGGRVELTRFLPHILTAWLFPRAPYLLTDSQVNLTFQFKADGLKTIQAELGGDLPRLAIKTKKESLLLQGKNLKASFLMDPGGTAFTLNQLQLSHPQLSLAGNLRLTQEDPQIRLELQGRDVDVSSTREVALALAGHVAHVKKIFRIVRGGKVPLIALKARGRSFAELGDLENIRIEGGMVEGRIAIPDVALDLEGAKGNVTISKGILEAENLEAKSGKSWGRKGQLRLGLKGGDTQLRLDTLVEGDLSQLLPILRRLIDNKSFLQEINLVEDLKGRARGRLLLGERTESLKVRVDVSELKLSAKYKRVPFPLAIQGGPFSYDENQIQAKNLKGKVGGSTFSLISAGLTLKKPPYLEMKLANLDLLTHELYPWFSSLKEFPIQPEDMKSLKGHILYSALDLRGPLMSPDKWESKHSGQLRNLVIQSRRVPETLEIQRANFEASVYPKKQTLSFNDAQVRMQDASMTMSGNVYDYFKGLRNIDLLFRGHIGPQSNKWVAQFLNLPPTLALNPPLSLSEGRLVWERDRKTSLVANLTVEKGPVASIDIFMSPEETRLNRLLIKDEISQATIAFQLKKRELGLQFSGNLEKSTLNNLFSKGDFLRGRIEGDFRAQISLDRPMKSTAQGRLVGEGLLSPHQMGIPLEIDRIVLDAEKKGLKVQKAILISGSRRMTLRGDMAFSPSALVFDVGVETDGIRWEELRALIEKEVGEAGDQEEQGGKRRQRLYNLPIEGTLRLKSDYFNYDRFTWFPFHADITFHPDEVDVAILEARLCDISTPGDLEITPGKTSLDFDLAARDQDLSPTTLCLSGKNTDITGRFDLLGKVTAQGKRGQLRQSLKGKMEFTARDGRIRRHMPLQKLFAYLNLMESLRGKLPDMSKEDFPYKSITAKGDIKNGKLILQEGIIDTPSMEIIGHGNIDLLSQILDLTLLVAPFKTIDWAIKKIPLVSGILKGTLVAIPVKVEGDVADPTVKKLSPSAVGSRLLGIMKRTLKLPFQVLEPEGPGAEEQPVEPEE